MNEDFVCGAMVDSVCPILCYLTVWFIFFQIEAQTLKRIINKIIVPLINLQSIFASRSQNYEIYCYDLFARLIAITLLMQSIDNNHSNETKPKPLRFSFIDKMLKQTRPPSLPSSLQPLTPLHTISTSSTRPSCDDGSARSILKRTIIHEHQAIPFQKKRDPLMMKGKMLSGIKKPLVNQMAQLLQGINERITRETQKLDKESNIDLPILSRENQERDDNEQKSNFKYSEIFKKLNEIRDRKTTDEFVTFIKPKTRRNSDLTPHPKVTSHSRPSILTLDIAHSAFPSTERKKSKAPDSPCKLPIISLKKGYLAYDQQGKIFLEQYRKNMTKQFQTCTQKSKQLTAKSFLIVQCHSMTPIVGRGCDQSIEVASISKIMTFYLSLLVCKKYEIDMYTHQVRVSDKAAETPGTTAELQSGDLITIYDLFLGLMLPSGNDASVALAQAMGKIIQRHKQKQTKKTYYQTFIAHMNVLARQMRLTQSWNNSSGLSACPNTTTPISMAILTSVALKDPIFTEIVNTKKYQVEVKNDRYGLSRKLFWRNTNKLLDCGWQGVKTGTTQTAGHCLMALKNTTLIAVYGCDTLARRFSECVYLYEKYSSIS